MEICALQQIITMRQYSISQIPLSPLRSRWLVKKKKGKKSQAVIICAINGAGYVPVE